MSFQKQKSFVLKTDFHTWKNVCVRSWAKCPHLWAIKKCASRHMNVIHIHMVKVLNYADVISVIY